MEVGSEPSLKSNSMLSVSAMLALLYVERLKLMLSGGGYEMSHHRIASSENVAKLSSMLSTVRVLSFLYP